MNPASSSLPTCSSSKRKRDQASLDESSCKRLKYDLFLNYSSEDIGKSFISHVHGELVRKGFTISDHTKLPVGQEFCSELLKAIDESEISVLVFSIKYASSLRCLDELVHIMNCRDKFVQKKVLPVFFDVDPSHVRNQEGPFKEAFEAHTNNFDHQRVQKWRDALNDAGQLSGLHYKYGDEYSFIHKIVKELQSLQKQPEHYVPNHLVGIESRVEKLLSILILDLKDVSIVAVLGISTITNAMYNRLAAEFDASCFLEVIRYDYSNPASIVEMQKLLISGLSQNDKLPMIHNRSQGVAKIIKFTRSRKVLLVFDDVTNVKQLEAFGIDLYNASLLNTHFGGGSRIIVTTRDKASLGSLPYASYNTSLLNRMESIELLTRLIYEKGDPIDVNFVEQIASCASGLPLVLEVWSRLFKGFKVHEREQSWPNVLKKLKVIPHGDVQEQLQITYNFLFNTAKNLFLDIACFFDGMDMELIVKVLHDEDKDKTFFWDQEIRCLADKCLVIITSGLPSRVLMHHAIRKMGQEIVRQENEAEPGQRTRLTNHKDVLHVLKEFSGSHMVKSIRQGRMTVHIDACRKMKNLRFIRFDDVDLPVPGNPLGCSCEGMHPLSFPMLKYLEWRKFPYGSINIDMCNVVVILLKNALIRTLWEGSKRLKKLKILDVSGSQSLTKTGNFIGLENLEHLHFTGCENLEELDNSLWCLDKLVTLDLHSCYQLKRFPLKMEGKLRSLQVLDLSGCESIDLKMMRLSSISCLL